MDKAKRLKEIEDEILSVVGAWSPWKRAVTYRYLYNLGLRVNDIDRVIRLGLKEEEAQESKP